MDLLLWLAQLHWMPPGAGQVTFIELALDFEATAGWALPPSPQSSLQGVALSLHDRARVLRVASVVLKRHSPLSRGICQQGLLFGPAGCGPASRYEQVAVLCEPGAMARQLAALQAYSEHRVARNRCRVPQDGRAP